jgi:hypothetical protein
MHHRLKIMAIAILLCVGLAACEDRGNNQTGGAKERSGPNEGARGPGSPANPGNP